MWLRIGLGEEASTYLGSADSRNAIFDCNGVADAVQYEDGHVFAKSSARTSCALVSPFERLVGGTWTE